MLLFGKQLANVPVESLILIDSFLARKKGLLTVKVQERALSVKLKDNTVSWNKLCNLNLPV